VSTAGDKNLQRPCTTYGETVRGEIKKISSVTVARTGARVYYYVRGNSERRLDFKKIGRPPVQASAQPPRCISVRDDGDDGDCDGDGGTTERRARGVRRERGGTVRGSVGDVRVEEKRAAVSGALRGGAGANDADSGHAARGCGGLVGAGARDVIRDEREDGEEDDGGVWESGVWAWE